MTKKLRLNLPEINKALLGVEKNWRTIDDELEEQHIGRKDIPFNSIIRTRMFAAYEYLDTLLAEGREPFAPESLKMMLELNHLVHYGQDARLKLKYHQAVIFSTKKFNQYIGAIHDWYKRHEKKRDPALKIAAEIYVSILGYPQLFDEGNHRTGALISSWINVYHGYPPFVLSTDHEIAYFAPSSEIKKFADKSTWRGRRKLPKYKKSFRTFWENHLDERYIQKT